MWAAVLAAGRALLPTIGRAVLGNEIGKVLGGGEGGGNNAFDRDPTPSSGRTQRRVIEPPQYPMNRQSPILRTNVERSMQFRNYPGQ
jgi:hypothetical protein